MYRSRDIQSTLAVTLDDQGHRCAECFEDLRPEESFLDPAEKRMWVCSGCFVKLLPDIDF